MVIQRASLIVALAAGAGRVPAVHCQTSNLTAEAIVAAAIQYQYDQRPDSTRRIVIDSESSGVAPAALAARIGASVQSGETLVKCEDPPPGLKGPMRCTMPPDLILVTYGGLKVDGDVATVDLSDRSLWNGEVYMSAVRLELERTDLGAWGVSRVLLRAAG